MRMRSIKKENVSGKWRAFASRHPASHWSSIDNAHPIGCSLPKEPLGNAT
jgi:hypothetical protein